MHLEGRANYNNIFEPTLLQIEDSTGRIHSFQPASEPGRNFSSVLEDIPERSMIRHYKLTTDDNIDPITGYPLPSKDRIAFHYLIHPQMRAVIIPPNAFDIIPKEHTRKGISEEVQRFFEMLAYKHGYRLITGITSQAIQANNQRIVEILGSLGYYMGPPSEKKGVYYGVHQSTYTGNGLPEVNTEHEYLMPPTIQ